MAVSAGIITATGGLVSHAAVVARGWGLAAVVGVESLVIDGTGARTADGVHRISPGDAVTLDGTTGEVWLGGDPDSPGAERPDVNAILADALPELLRLEEWAAKAGRHDLSRRLLLRTPASRRRPSGPGTRHRPLHVHVGPHRHRRRTRPDHGGGIRAAGCRGRLAGGRAALP
jgi:pyruvate,orthophosphate dikinase